MQYKILIKLFLSLFLLLTTSNCTKSIDNLALGVLYPFDSVNKRIDERGSKEEPPFTDLVALPSGGHAWMSKRTDGRTTVIYFHGNGESVVDLYDYKFLENVLSVQGYNFAVVDYPGVGIGGVAEPTEESLVTMGSEALTALLRRVSNKSNVIVWGRSLGAAVASQVTKKHQKDIHKLVLVSPWTSFENAAEEKAMGRLISDRFFKKHGYLTNAACQEIDIQTLLVHGDQDKLIPFSHSASLRSCFSDSSLFKVQNKGHNDLYTAETLRHIIGFIGGSN